MQTWRRHFSLQTAPAPAPCLSHAHSPKQTCLNFSAALKSLFLASSHSPSFIYVFLLRLTHRLHEKWKSDIRPPISLTIRRRKCDCVTCVNLLKMVKQCIRRAQYFPRTKGGLTSDINSNTNTNLDYTTTSLVRSNYDALYT